MFFFFNQCVQYIIFYFWGGYNNMFSKKIPHSFFYSGKQKNREKKLELLYSIVPIWFP